MHMEKPQYVSSVDFKLSEDDIRSIISDYFRQRDLDVSPGNVKILTETPDWQGQHNREAKCIGAVVTMFGEE